jgi:hypothetical protein
MGYFKNFDVKKMFFRVVTLGYTAFLAGFCKDYVVSANVTHAINEGTLMLWQGLVAGFGLDQIIYHNTNSSN